MISNRSLASSLSSVPYQTAAINHSSAVAAASAIAASFSALSHQRPIQTNVTVVAESTTITTPPQPIVNVSLEIQLLSADKLYPTPSMADNLPFEIEFDLRLVGCELIQTAGRLLKLPQTALATGQVLFHRYFYSKSFIKNPMEVNTIPTFYNQIPDLIQVVILKLYAMASVFLSSKIEEFPRRIREVMNVFHHIKQVRTGK